MKKQTAEQILKDLPNSFSVDELIERLIVIDKINDGLEDVKQGKTISHQKVKQEIAKWTK